MIYAINEEEAPILIDPTGSDCVVEWLVTGVVSYSVTGGSWTEDVGGATSIHASVSPDGMFSVSTGSWKKTYQFSGTELVEVAS
jgi:hypothetical protein